MHAPFVQLGRLRQTLARDPSTVGESGCTPAGRSLGFVCRQDSRGLSEKDLKSMLLRFAEKKGVLQGVGSKPAGVGCSYLQTLGKGSLGKVCGIREGEIAQGPLT